MEFREFMEIGEFKENVILGRGAGSGEGSFEAVDVRF